MDCRREQQSKTNVYGCDLNFGLLSSLKRFLSDVSDIAGYPRSIVLAVGRRTEGPAALRRIYGKSPCFSRSRVLTIADLEHVGSFSHIVNIGIFLECL